MFFFTCLQDFRGPRFQSSSLTEHGASLRIARLTKSRLTQSYPDASSADALTCLSYTAICLGCPRQYQRFQISPQRPDTSRCPQQPTGQDQVVPFPAPLNEDSHLFASNRVGHVAVVPVSVSPNHLRDWVERGIAAPSALRSRTSPITGIRLRRQLD